MHHPFFWRFICSLTYQTINLTIIMIKICFQDMDSKETGCTCDHNVSHLFFGYPVHILFRIPADHALDPVIIVIREFLSTLCIIKCSTVINHGCQLTDRRVFKNICIHDRYILWKTHNGNFWRCKRRTTKIKEVVLNSHFLSAQCFFKYLTKFPLHTGNRLYIAGILCRDLS